MTSNKPTMVLAPGFMTDHDLWRDVVPHFSDYNVVYADFREGATLQELAASNLSRCPERFVLMGFSLGGYIARYMLYQAPERVQALILVGTSTRPSGPSVSGPATNKMFRGMSRAALVRAVHTSRAENEDLIQRMKDMGWEVRCLRVSLPWIENRILRRCATSNALRWSSQQTRID